MQNRVSLTALPTASAFIRDYADPQGFDKVRSFFAYDPHACDAAGNLDCYDARLSELNSLAPELTAHRSAAADALAAQQRRWGGHLQSGNRSALDACDALKGKRTYAIVTGQQVGLFGGPLYTQLKAIAAIKLARELEERYDECRFIPMFWMASSDHDFEEVRRSFILDRSGVVQEISLPAETEADAGRTVESRLVGPALQDALAQLEELLPGGEQREAVLAALREDYGSAEALSGPGGMLLGFARFMARLFDGTGLVLVDPQDPALMQFMRPLLRAELEHAAESEAALTARNEQLQAAGYPLQVEQLPGDTSLFLLSERGKRQKISRVGASLDSPDSDLVGPGLVPGQPVGAEHSLSSAEEGADTTAPLQNKSGGDKPAPLREFQLRGTDQRFSLDELLALVDSAPGRFVPGVMLRPLQQNLLIPPLAFIGGAAEIAYRAQTTAVFELHKAAGRGASMAPAFLRASATLLPQKSAELLDELGWELADFYAPPQDLAGRAVSGERPEEIAHAIEEYLEALHSAEARLKAEAVKLDPNLELTFETLRGNLIKHVETLSKKIDNVLKQRADSRLKRVAAAAALIYPRAGGQSAGANAGPPKSGPPKNGPQERMLGIASFLPRYGFELTARLLDELDFPCWEHQVVIL